MKTFIEFVNTYKNKKIDYDGVYGVQCVDLIKKYIKECFGVTPLSIGHAKEYWTKRNQSYLKSMFVPVINTRYTKPRAGDIFIRSSGTYGHIGICTGKGDTKKFYAYEENYNGTHEGMTLHEHTDWKSINFLRPKYQYVTAKNGLRGYKKYNGTVKDIVIPYNSKVEIIETECYRQLKDKTTYTFIRVLYKGVKYYVAEDFVSVR